MTINAKLRQPVIVCQGAFPGVRGLRMRWLAAGLLFAGALTAGKASAGAAGDIAAGLNMFDHGCTSCHDDSDYMVKAAGPALFGVVGRPVGSVAGFKYSPALLAAHRNGDVWTIRRLEAFLANPGHMYP